MRVVAGEAGGVPLLAPPGKGTRPTSDKLKGAIFSSLGDLGCQGRVLDLFAGSGALGIEALSRGAEWCDFVDSAPAACKTIRANLAKTKLTEQAAVHCLPVERYLASALPPAPYDLILLDPPYALPEMELLLERLASRSLVGASTALLVEHRAGRTLPSDLGPLTRVKSRQHGDSAFSLYLRGTANPSQDGALGGE